jgi:Cu(I)/Ag(I) efflux system membrane fusion protein
MKPMPSKTKRLLWIAAAVVAAVVVLFVGASLLSGPDNTSPTTATGAEVWTCSMHPQVRLPKPGKCPICSMPLIPANKQSQPKATEAKGASEAMLELSEHARAMATVETAAVERRKLTRELRAFGKVQYNESALATITARVDGYIERLFIDYTGVQVKAGDHLVEIYSPELVVAQSELLMDPPRGNIVELTRRKLRRWEVSDAQIDEVLRTRKPLERITLSSPIDATVTEKLVVQKSSVKAGDVLYRLANLETVWVYLDVYEADLGSVRYGQTVEIATEAYPKEPVTGRVWFINPTLNDETRTVKVLVNIANAERRLKPGMFVSATIRTPLLANGQPGPTGVEGKWTCAMHPQVLEEKSGPCAICKMPLTQIPAASGPVKAGDELVLAAPVTAVLDSGVRKLVYVEKAPGEYAGREVKVGPRAGDFYPILSGLAEGERVAVRGAFLLDSQFQISGMPSLFFEHGQSTSSGGHQHGGGPAAPPPEGAPAGPNPPGKAAHQH